MANQITARYDLANAMTITLASLADAAARQSTIVDNSTLKQLHVTVFVKFTTGTTPVAGSTVDVYLIKSDGTLRTDGAGASDAAITIENARLLGTIVVTSASDTTYIKEFDIPNPGSEWGIAVENNTNVTANATGGNFAASWDGQNPDVQAS